MLRIVGLVLSTVVFAAAYAERDVSEEDMAAARERSSAVLQAADTVMTDVQFADDLARKRRGVGGAAGASMPGITLPDRIDGLEGWLEAALGAGENVEAYVHEGYRGVTPLILISLDMPADRISQLAAEADLMGATLALRGLVENDLGATAQALYDIQGDALDLAVVVDPTLFRRFSVTRVPTFILPLESIPECTNTSCETPAHAKATGSASLRYVLEAMSRGGNDQVQREALKWLERY